MVAARSFFSVLLMLICLAQLNAQNPTEQMISYSFDDRDFENVLLELSEVGEFDFAFNPAIIDPDVLYSGKYDSVRISFILNEICTSAGLKWQYSNGMLLVKSTKREKESPVNSSISGKVYLADGGTFQSASVKGSDLDLYGGTDSEGNYRLFLPVPEYPLKLKVYSPGYQEKTVHLNSRYQKSFYVKLLPDTAESSEEIDDIRKVVEPTSGSDSALLREITDYFPGNFLIPEHLVDTAQASEFVREQNAQASLIAGSGTNGAETGLYENMLSANLLTGYNAGIKGFEIGMLNFNRFTVTGAQIAIAGNSTGGRLEGIQWAGLYNHNLLGTTGGQFCGIYNESRFFVKGMQSSLVNQVQGKLYGAQLGGVYNVITDDGYGMQAAGLINVSETKLDGAQFSGVFNSAQEINGTQISAVNKARFLKGAQIGLLNVSRLNSGFQLGLINVTDSLNGGFFGLLNFIRGGYVSMEISYDEANFATLLTRSGTKGFYTSFGLGIHTDPAPEWNEMDLYKLTAGIGRLNRILKPIAIQTELFYSATGSIDRFYGHLGTVNLALYIELFKRLGITAGPNFNFFASDLGLNSFAIVDGGTVNINDARPLNHNGYVLWTEFDAPYFYQAWIGGRVGMSWVF